MEEKELNETEVLQNIVYTLVDNPVNVTVDIRPTNRLEAWLMKWPFKSKPIWPFKPSKIVYSLKPLRVGNMYRIAAKAVKMPELKKDDNLTEAVMAGLANHSDDIIYIVAVGIQNNRKEPTKRLMQFIRDEFTMKEIVGVLNQVLIKINMEAFIHTILLIKGANALKGSQQGTKE